MHQWAGLASGHLQKSRGRERVRERGKSARVKGSKRARARKQIFSIHRIPCKEGRERASLAQKLPGSKNIFLVKQGKNLPIADCKGSLGMEPKTVRSRCAE